MIRWISLFVSVLLLLTICSCGNREETGEENPETPRAQSQPSPSQLPASENRAAGSNMGENMPTDAVRLAPTAIVDWYGFQQPMVAATMFVPYGWTAEGGIAWGDAYACTNGYAYNWRAKSKDNARGVAILPQQRWEWNAAGKPGKIGCAIAQIDNVADYIQTVIAQVRPDARIIKTYQRHDLERQFARLNSEADTGFQFTQTRIHAGEAIIEFTENQRKLRGVATAAVLFTYIRTGGTSYGVTTENWIGYALPTYVAYAPVSEFNYAFFDGIRRSFTPDPQWEKRISGHNATIGRINREGIMKRAEISSQTYEAIRKMSKQAWDRQQVSADRRMREFSEYIRDVETYDDPKSDLGKVELDSGFAHAWRLDDGTYVLTNDHIFNPAKTMGQFGEEIKISP